MTRNSGTPYANLFSGLTVGFIILTIALYLLRGFGILTFIPGGIIYLSFVCAIAALIPCQKFPKFVKFLQGDP